MFSKASTKAKENRRVKKKFPILPFIIIIVIILVLVSKNKGGGGGNSGNRGGRGPSLLDILVLSTEVAEEVVWRRIFWWRIWEEAVWW
jgi:uncharacterized protein